MASPSCCLGGQGLGVSPSAASAACPPSPPERACAAAAAAAAAPAPHAGRSSIYTCLRAGRSPGRAIPPLTASASGLKNRKQSHKGQNCNNCNKLH